MATTQKKSGASKGKGKSTTVLKDLDAKRVAGRVKGGGTAKVRVSDIQITKPIDKSSPAL